MRGNFAVLILALVLQGFSVWGQGASDSETLTLPDSVMKQVVGRILIWHFKPSANPKTVPVSERGIKREWLPEIQNIKFQLVSDTDALNAKKGVFLFEGPQRADGHYSINVGWGDFACRGIGDTWDFRIKRNNKIRLWHAKGHGWGRGCGGIGPPTIRGLQVGEISPNELRGFQFFSKGRLHTVRLGISEKEDIARIFGDSCETQCNYDDNWLIRADYFDTDAAFAETIWEGGKREVKYEYFPKAEYVGKLQAIYLRSKKPTSYRNKRFSQAFEKNISNSISEAWDENGFRGAVHTTSKTYSDGYGLKYVIFDKETFNNLKVRQKKAESDIQSGDLVQIEYSIPNSLRDAFYIRQPKLSK